MKYSATNFNCNQQLVINFGDQLSKNRTIYPIIIFISKNCNTFGHIDPKYNTFIKYVKYVK